jgi:hypothetical protein
MIITREQLKNVTGCDYYDGSVIHERFAYKFFKKQTQRVGNIVAFVAPMEVTDNLIDLEDSINKDFIYSESAINLIMEIPNIDLFGGVCFQRLYNAQLGSLLCGKYIDKEGFVDGDDIKILEKEGDEPKKASVSIAAQVNNAILIHTGININAGDRAPSFAYSTNLTEEKAKEFMEECCNMFYSMAHDIFVATAKVIV